MPPKWHRPHVKLHTHYAECTVIRPIAVFPLQKYMTDGRNQLLNNTSAYAPRSKYIVGFLNLAIFIQFLLLLQGRLQKYVALQLAIEIAQPSVVQIHKLFGHYSSQKLKKGNALPKDHDNHIHPLKSLHMANSCPPGFMLVAVMLTF